MHRHFPKAGWEGSPFCKRGWGGGGGKVRPSGGAAGWLPAWGSIRVCVSSSNPRLQPLLSHVFDSERPTVALGRWAQTLSYFRMRGDGTLVGGGVLNLFSVPRTASSRPNPPRPSTVRWAAPIDVQSARETQWIRRTTHHTQAGVARSPFPPSSSAGFVVGVFFPAFVAPPIENARRAMAAERCDGPGNGHWNPGGPVVSRRTSSRRAAAPACPPARCVCAPYAPAPHNDRAIARRGGGLGEVPSQAIARSNFNTIDTQQLTRNQVSIYHNGF